MNFILMAEIYGCKFLYICSVPEGRSWFLILRMWQMFVDGGQEGGWGGGWVGWASCGSVFSLILSLLGDGCLS